MLKPDNFQSGEITIRLFDNSLVMLPVYSYESANALYDICIWEGRKFYRVNSGAWSNLISNITPIHVAIERHFNI